MKFHEIISVTASENKKLKIAQLTLVEKVYTKRKRRPLPEIKTSQSRIGNSKKDKSFNTDSYEKKNSLCDCEVKRALFCFPSLIFGGDTKWSIDGLININKMTEKMEKHELSINIS